MIDSHETSGVFSPPENTNDIQIKSDISDASLNGEPKITEEDSKTVEKGSSDNPNITKWGFDFDSLTENIQKAFNEEYEKQSNKYEYNQNRKQYMDKIGEMDFGKLADLGSQLGFNDVQEMHKKLDSMSGQELYRILSPTTETEFTLEDFQSLAAVAPELDFALKEVESGRTEMGSKEAQGRVQGFIDGHTKLRRFREFSNELNRMQIKLFTPRIQEYNFENNKFEALPFIFGNNKITLSEEQSSELSKLLNQISEKEKYDNYQLLDSGKIEYQETQDKVDATIENYLETHTPLAIEELPQKKELQSPSPIIDNETIETVEPTSPNSILPDEKLTQVHHEFLPTYFTMEKIRENSEISIDKITATELSNLEYFTVNKSRKIYGTEVCQVRLRIDEIDKILHFIEVPDSYNNEARQYITGHGEKRLAKFGMAISKKSSGEIIDINYFCPGDEKRDGYSYARQNIETGRLEGYFSIKVSEKGELKIVNNNYGSEQIIVGKQYNYDSAEAGYCLTLNQYSKDIRPSMEIRNFEPKELYRGVVANKEKILKGINIAMKKIIIEQSELTTEEQKDPAVLLSRLLSLSLFPAKEHGAGVFASTNPDVASIYIADRTRTAEVRKESGQGQYGIVFKIANSEGMSFRNEKWRDASPDNYVSDKFDILSPLLADSNTLDLLKNVTIESITTPSSNTYFAGSEDFNSVVKQLLEEAQKNS